MGGPARSIVAARQQSAARIAALAAKGVEISQQNVHRQGCTSPTLHESGTNLATSTSFTRSPSGSSGGVRFFRGTSASPVIIMGRLDSHAYQTVSHCRASGACDRGVY